MSSRIKSFNRVVEYKINREYKDLETSEGGKQFPSETGENTISAIGLPRPAMPRRLPGTVEANVYKQLP
ncbi:hypothetical protein J6590_008222 [Homalodisca vitripennis]|nr:hypothetical protein J6590_008222 [Homalodisca vitripennis]